jgi:phytoene synthase
MGSMSYSSNNLTPEDWKQLDERLRRIDEDRWLSSRYAAADDRNVLIALYLFYYELARVRLVVTEATMGAIRFQWWRDALDELSEVADGQVRQHDVVMALRDVLAGGRLSMSALKVLIDEHEAAYEAHMRESEPEARLAAMAAQVLVGTHSWGEVMQSLAPHWAALRRGEHVGFGPVVEKAPSALRPAVAHFRLRRLYAKGRGDKALRRRFCVMLGVLTGRV